MSHQINPTETIYDHPLYYDILFSWDRSQEADFYQSVFLHFGIEKREHVLEVACGGGQIGRVLAQRGWTLTGLDSREPMLAFFREQSERLGVTVDTLCADMVDFGCATRFGAAYNPLSSFLLLHDDELAEAHLATMASVLRTGAVYILDLGLGAETDADAQTTDAIWEMSRGDISVRALNNAVHVHDADGHRVLPWGVGTHLRAVTSQWLEDRVGADGRFAIESWHPECGRTADGVSQWSLEHRSEPPVFERAMVILRRV